MKNTGLKRQNNYLKGLLVIVVLLLLWLKEKLDSKDCFCPENGNDSDIIPADEQFPDYPPEPMQSAEFDVEAIERASDVNVMNFEPEKLMEDFDFETQTLKIRTV